MTTRQAAHIVTVALADVCFDDTDMSAEVAALCDEYQSGEIPDSVLCSRVQMILDEGDFGVWVKGKVFHALVNGIKEY
ncbi:MAG: hypothetical protein OXM61_17335 [Candidatus Poribacteria bacterium]|nr:hypothetical protein [Candidatus Poribacteria bacterium]